MPAQSSAFAQRISYPGGKLQIEMRSLRFQDHWRSASSPAIRWTLARSFPVSRERPSKGRRRQQVRLLVRSHNLTQRMPCIYTRSAWRPLKPMRWPPDRSRHLN